MGNVEGSLPGERNRCPGETRPEGGERGNGARVGECERLLLVSKIWEGQVGV